MKNLDKKLFHEESFVDNIVKSMNVDFINKITKIDTDGGWIDSNEYGYLKKAQIKIYNWSSVAINLFDNKLKKFESVDLDESRKLSVIIEFHLSDTKLKLVGFGVHGGWIEWIFINPQIEISGEVDEDS